MATRKIRQKVIVFIVAFCLMIPMTSFVSAAGNLNLTIDDDSISWNDIGSGEYDLYVKDDNEEDNGVWIAIFFPFPGEELGYSLQNLNKAIDKEIRKGNLQKKGSGDPYTIRVVAYAAGPSREDIKDDLDYYYESSAERIQVGTINNVAVNPDTETISWDAYDPGEYQLDYYQITFLPGEDESPYCFSVSRSDFFDESGRYEFNYDQGIENMARFHEIDFDEKNIQISVQAKMVPDTELLEEFWDCWEYLDEEDSFTIAEGSIEQQYSFKELAPKSLLLAKISVSNATYTGKEVKPNPVVIFNGKKLILGKDYAVDYEDNVDAGDEACVDIYGRGIYTGYVYKYFTIYKASNKLSVKGKTAKVKFSKLKKKAQKLSASKVLKFKNKGQGKLSFKKVSGNKKIKIDKKTGKVTVGKGLKKGTYKIKVKVKAAGDDNYKASSWKNVKFKISVK